MISTSLILAYLGCISSGAMLSMLLLLVASYVLAAMWLISNGIIYTGLLYVLVYVGAIVVLIMFVVQLTNTSLSADNVSISNTLLVVQNIVLVLCLSVLILFSVGYANSNSVLDSNVLLSISQPSNPLGLSTSTVQVNNLLSNLSIDSANNLSTLATSIFNEYGYILVLSVHAIILAIIGPIKLALSDLK